MSTSTIQAFPIAQTALEQLRKVGLRAPKTAGAQIDQERCMITQLPGELRNKIYEYLIPDVAFGEYDVAHKGASTHQSDYTFQLYALAQICRMLHAEYASLLRTRLNFYIKLSDLENYLDTFHPAINPRHPFCRHGGLLILEEQYYYDYADFQDLDVLSLTRIIHESPDLTISFSQYDYVVDTYCFGNGSIQTLLQNYPHWKHLSDQLTAVGLERITLRYESQDLIYSSGVKRDRGYYECLTLVLHFGDVTDESCGPSLLTDPRARLVTRWIFQSGLLGMWYMSAGIAIECKKTNGQGVHYWKINDGHPTNKRQFRSLEYAYESAEDGDSMLCNHVIEAEAWRSFGRKCLQNTRYPTFKPLPAGSVYEEDFPQETPFQVFEFGHDLTDVSLKQEVWSVPEDGEVLDTWSMRVSFWMFETLQIVAASLLG